MKSRIVTFVAYRKSSWTFFLLGRDVLKIAVSKQLN